MNKNLPNLIIFLLVVFSVLIGTILWDKINFNYNNPQEVLGNYSKFKITPITETARYLTFVILPIITFLTSFYYFKRTRLMSLKKILYIETFPENKKNLLLNIFLFTFLFASIINFFAAEFSYFKIDLFHEGLALSGAYNNKISKSLWTNSYLVTGLFYEILNAKISWIISGYETLGSWRFYNLFLGLFVEILIIIFCFKLSKIFNLKKNLEIIFFLILAISSVYLNREMIIGADAYRPRDLPILLFLLISINLFTKNNNNFLSCFSIGCLSIISLLWSLDKGVYISLSILPLAFLLLLKKKKYQVLFILFGVSLSWFLFYVTVGSEEFKAFLVNSISIIKTHDFLNAIVHPTPFSFVEENAERGTRNLLIIIINAIFILSSLLSNKNSIPKNSLLFLLLFYILAFVNYKSGMSRSDGPHMKQSIFFHLIILISFLSYYFLFFEKYFTLKFKIKLSFYKVFLTVFLLFLILIYNNLNLKSYNNLLNFKSRYIKYVKVSDEFFLSNEQNKLVSKLKEMLKNENCFQTFTYESAMSYLVKKQSCTEFYVTYVIGSKNNQKKFIKQIKSSKPKYILASGPYKNFTIFSPEKRFPYISNFLKENYVLYEKVSNPIPNTPLGYSDWNILKLK